MYNSLGSIWIWLLVSQWTVNCCFVCDLTGVGFFSGGADSGLEESDLIGGGGTFLWTVFLYIDIFSNDSRFLSMYVLLRFDDLSKLKRLFTCFWITTGFSSDLVDSGREDVSGLFIMDRMSLEGVVDVKRKKNLQFCDGIKWAVCCLGK